MSNNLVDRIMVAERVATECWNVGAIQWFWYGNTNIWKLRWSAAGWQYNETQREKHAEYLPWERRIMHHRLPKLNIIRFLNDDDRRTWEVVAMKNSTFDGTKVCQAASWQQSERRETESRSLRIVASQWSQGFVVGIRKKTNNKIHGHWYHYPGVASDNFIDLNNWGYYWRSRWEDVTDCSKSITRSPIETHSNITNEQEGDSKSGDRRKHKTKVSQKCTFERKYRKLSNEKFGGSQPQSYSFIIES